MLHGGCLCGKVRYELDGLLRHVTHCHCSMCRKQHGAAFATYGALSRSRFRIVKGDASLATYASSDQVRRQFCRECGSSLFWLHTEHPGVVDVALGTLDDDPGGRPVAHIFVASKAPWHDITDDLQQHEGALPRSQ